MRNVILVCGVVLLAGCKLEISSEVPYSKIFEKDISTAKSSLIVEVAACNSYEDSRQPSNSLKEARSAIADLMPEAEYQECYTQKMSSYAKFSFPIAYGAADSVKAQDPKIRVLSYQNQYAFFDIAPSLKQKLKAYQDGRVTMSGFDPSDMTINIAIVNDTQTQQLVDLSSVYIEGYPLINVKGYKLEKGSVTHLRLSNVSTDTAFLPAEHKMMAYFMTKSEK